MKILIVTPAPPRSRYGNRTTALRWARILRGLGHRVILAQNYLRGAFDLLVALHARRSYPSISRFHRRRHSRAPIVVALTGTDLYRDLRLSLRARKSLELATRIVVLQPKALDELQPSLRRKARVIYQSVKAEGLSGRPRPGAFDVCVVGYLRPVKDPFRAALAARLLPRSSAIRVLLVGGAMTKAMAARARAEMKVNPRYRWLGERSRESTRRILRSSRVMVLSSRMEGGANVLSEAIVASVPVIASRIPGSVGILGPSYPGYFTAGDTHGLARLLLRAERDAAFLARLKAQSRRLAPLFHPARERRAWADLLEEITSLQSLLHASVEC